MRWSNDNTKKHTRSHKCLSLLLLLLFCFQQGFTKCLWQLTNQVHKPHTFRDDFSIFSNSDLSHHILYRCGIFKRCIGFSHSAIISSGQMGNKSRKFISFIYFLFRFSTDIYFCMMCDSECEPEIKKKKRQNYANSHA